jgi:hypothetical protein
MTAEIIPFDVPHIRTRHLIDQGPALGHVLLDIVCDDVYKTAYVDGLAVDLIALEALPVAAVVRITTLSELKKLISRFTHSERTPA